MMLGDVLPIPVIAPGSHRGLSLASCAVEKPSEGSRQSNLAFLIVPMLLRKEAESGSSINLLRMQEIVTWDLIRYP